MLLKPLNSEVHWSKGCRIGWADVDCPRARHRPRRPRRRRATRHAGRTARNSIISVLTQCESDFILDDSAPLKLAQYCRKQENILRKKILPETRWRKWGRNARSQSTERVSAAICFRVYVIDDAVDGTTPAVNVNEHGTGYTLLRPRL